MDTGDCGESPNGPAWVGQGRRTRRWGWIMLSIGLAILADGPAIAQSHETSLHDAGRTPERPGMPERHDKECKKSEHCPTTVRQLGPLDSIIADDILAQMHAVPFTPGHHTPILLQGKMLPGLTKREQKSMKKTYRAGYTIVLLDATMEHVAALHGIIKEGVIPSSKDGAGVLAYSLRRERHIPTATLLSNVHRSPLRTSLGEPDPTGLQDEEQARKRAAALTVNELAHWPMRPSQNDPDPTDLQGEEQEHEQATDRTASNGGRRPNVRMLQPPDPQGNENVDWQTSPVQKTVFQQNGATGVYNTTVNLYALHSCQADVRTGLTSDYYMVTALADWTPTNAKFQSAATELGDSSMYYVNGTFVVAAWRDDPQRTYCSSPPADSTNADICRYVNYPLRYDLTMKPQSTGSVVQIDAKPPATQGQTTTYTSGFNFSLGGTVNISGKGPSAGISAGVTWTNTQSTTVPPLELGLSQTDSQGADWTFKYCTGGEEPDPNTNCTSHVQTAKDVCRAQLGDDSGTNPQQGQTPNGAFTDAVQTALWQAAPDTRAGRTTFDIEVTVVPNIGVTTANLWDDDIGASDAGCNAFSCDCVSKTTTTQLPGGSYVFKIPLPSTTCE